MFPALTPGLQGFHLDLDEVWDWVEEHIGLRVIYLRWFLASYAASTAHSLKILAAAIITVSIFKAVFGIRSWAV